jgi:hypothetical protein
MKKKETCLVSGFPIDGTQQQQHRQQCVRLKVRNDETKVYIQGDGHQTNR